MHLRIYFLVVSIFCICFITKAQEFGGNPPKLHWLQIDTDTARIIFPQEVRDAAERVAATVHQLQRNHTSDIGQKLRKINIILQNQTTLSNGYVGLGPWRSEFYLFPPQNSFELGALDWVNTLSLHEYRHVLQYSNFNRGLSKVASVLLGQQGQDFANAAAVPNWFFEGDAVFNETGLSWQGRGRLPYFFKGFQALQMQNRHYSYMKLRNGSLKDFVPDHYKLGYLLVGYGRQQYGPQFWKQVSLDAAAFKPIIYPWQNAVKKYSGISYKRFVSDAFEYYNSQWSKANATAATTLMPQAKGVEDYKYPYLTGTGDIVTLKRSYKQVPAIYLIGSGGKQEKLITRDIATDDYFSYNNGKLAYSTYKPNPRWGYREYSDIKVTDIETGKTTRVTRGKRFFSPDVAHNGQKVIAVEYRTNQVCQLIALDLNGTTLFRSKASRNLLYTFPKFSANDSAVYTCVRNDSGYMALLKIDLATGHETTLLPFANRIIGYPVVQGDTILVTSSYRGSDESWAYIESQNKAYRLAIYPTGLYQSFFKPTGQLVASAFTANGYRLMAFDAQKVMWQPINPKENTLPDLYIQTALRQKDSNVVVFSDTQKFNTSRYRQGLHLFNFHSWRPYYDDPEITYSLISENVLNTLQSELSYTYNRNEGSHNVGFNGVYGGWYVQPVVGVAQTFSRRISYNADTTLYYNEFNANVGFRLPLNFTSGKQYRYIRLNGSVNNQQVSWTGLSKRLAKNLNFNYYQVRLQYQAQIQKAVQHIYPRWAQTLLLQYNSALNKFTARQFLASAFVYLPGLAANHNLILGAAYHQRDTLRQYGFSNNFPFSRGYNAINSPKMYRLSANYHFPLFYPDFGFANIVYFKRIRGNLYYDHTRASLRTTNYVFNTTGLEVFFDTKWWNQQDVSFGIRYSRLLNNEYRAATNPNRWEIILPVGLFR